MGAADLKKTVLVLVLCALALMGASAFKNYLGRHLHKIGTFDWYLFTAAADHSIQTGDIYRRDLDAFGPSAETYKYPPLLVAILVAFKKMGAEDSTLVVGMMLVILFAVVLSAILCAHLAWQSDARMLALLASFFLLTFEPVMENLVRLQLEPLILLLLSLSMYALCRQRDFLSGALVGIATALKIYPLFFIMIYLLNRSRAGVCGFAVGALACLVFSIAVVGMGEHVFYFFQVLPMLLTEEIWTGPYHESISAGAILLEAGVSQSLAQSLCTLGLVLGVVGLWWFQKKIPLANLQERSILGFSGLVCLYLLLGKNAWWNYQLLLVLPVICLMGRLASKGCVDGLAISCLLGAGLCMYGAVDHNIAPRLDLLRHLATLVVPGWHLPENILSSALYLRFLSSLLVCLALVRVWGRARVPVA